MAAEPAQLAWWQPLVSAVVGVLLGFCLAEGRSFFARRRKYSSYWGALDAEIEFARGVAQGLLDENVAAPLGTLPDTCYQSCFPELLSEGVLSTEEATALMTFYEGVSTLNRGLERALNAINDPERHAEYGRNRVKAKRLIKGGAAYEAAKAAIQRHIK